MILRHRLEAVVKRFDALLQVACSYTSPCLCTLGAIVEDRRCRDDVAISGEL
jgi:hypothetical protein